MPLAPAGGSVPAPLSLAGVCGAAGVKWFWLEYSVVQGYRFLGELAARAPDALVSFGSQTASREG